MDIILYFHLIIRVMHAHSGESRENIENKKIIHNPIALRKITINSLVYNLMFYLSSMAFKKCYYTALKH